MGFLMSMLAVLGFLAASVDGANATPWKDALAIVTKDKVHNKTEVQRNPVMKKGFKDSIANDPPELTVTGEETAAVYVVKFKGPAHAQNISDPCKDRRDKAIECAGWSPDGKKEVPATFWKAEIELKKTPAYEATKNAISAALQGPADTPPSKPTTKKDMQKRLITAIAKSRIAVRKEFVDHHILKAEDFAAKTLTEIEAKVKKQYD